MSTLKEILKQKGAELLGDIIQAKKDGQPLPPAIDKIAGVAIAGQKEAIKMAEDYTRKKLVMNLGWIVTGVLVFVLGYVLLTK